MNKKIGILTAGGDSPGLNAAIRAVGKRLAAANCQLIGFRDGFEGIAFDRSVVLTGEMLSGILTIGGTILHTSRHKPNKMPLNGKLVDMSEAIIENYRKNRLSCLVCIGGGGTHKSALLLKKAGLNIVTIPKTIDNDLAMTDSSIGFDTALDVATGSIDSLHSTASSHKRIMLVEIMGHRTGWLALGSGIAGGADVILIPEFPYDLNKVAETLLQRSSEGKLFSIVPVAEGALSVSQAAEIAALEAQKAECEDKKKRVEYKQQIDKLTELRHDRIFEVAADLEKLTGLETRVTVLGHLQRGGKPSTVDRLRATVLGRACAEAILDDRFGVMVALRGLDTELVPLEKVAGKRREVTQDHPWVDCARSLGISFGD
ncbi:MAG: ATP-dependent 6-phosphofructokinase [Victivallaceae bacterium]|nr:ATP-dependent 6-phosphofructokinase [Victivallaceae bacterium]